MFGGYYLPIICMPLAVIGILDDIYKLPSLLRYFSQLITVLILLYLFSFNNYFITGLSDFFSIVIFLLIIIFGTAIINFSNFMDGIDGLVGGCFIIILISSAYINDINILPLAGSLVGFLALNWNPAKVFMEDAGSTFLGAILTGLIITSKDLISSITLILISFPLIVDAASCVIRRLLDRQNIFQAHKLHLYQRLHQSGMEHSQISMIYISTTLLLSLVYIFFGFQVLFLFSIISILFGIYFRLFHCNTFWKRTISNL